ncbi:hypothetical protein [Embleya sp. NBC_00896]|nr:hypothetical protein OG928_09620 [Embleya sp. NBC_00896]
MKLPTIVKASLVAVTIALSSTLVGGTGGAGFGGEFVGQAAGREVFRRSS